jgi:hypothetical protein
MYESVSTDGRIALRSDQITSGFSTTLQYTLWDHADEIKLSELDMGDEATGTPITTKPSRSLTGNGKYAAVITLATTRLFEVESGREIATFISFEDGEWIITTPNGYYNSSERGDQYFSVAGAGKQYSVSQLRESFYRPDLVASALAGHPLPDQRRHTGRH